MLKKLERKTCRTNGAFNQGALIIPNNGPMIDWRRLEKMLDANDPGKHSSLVDYLAQVTYAKNCPTTFYCIFQLVWVPMTTMQNIKVCFLSSNNTLSSKGGPL